MDSEDKGSKPENGDGATEKPTESSSSPAQQTSATGGPEHRRSRWATGAQALKYICDSIKDKAVKTRAEDKATNVLLMGALVASMTFVLCPVFEFALIAYDILLGLAIVFYAFQRLGIINKLNPREAVLCAQLLFVMTVFGVYVTMNVLIIGHEMTASSVESSSTVRTSNASTGK